MSENITTKNYKRLVLQIGVEGMSFCIFDTLAQTVGSITQTPFSKKVPLEDELWRVFVEHPELKSQYDEVLVLHDNSLNTFVPGELFDENFLGSYLQYNTKVFESDFFAFDTLDSYGINNVYVPLVNVNNYLIDRYGAFDYKNTNSILAARLLDASGNIDRNRVYIHVQDTHFELLVANNHKLLLFNSFEYSTPEDFLYYTLFAFEQLLLNPEIVPVFLLGKISEEHPCFVLAYDYIRNISLFEPETLMEKYNLSADKAREHFILLNA